MVLPIAMSQNLSRNEDSRFSRIGFSETPKAIR